MSLLDVTGESVDDHLVDRSVVPLRSAPHRLAQVLRDLCCELDRLAGEAGVPRSLRALV